MAASTQIKNCLNALLRPLNVRLDTWTAKDRERERLCALQARGGLDLARYALSQSMKQFDGALLARAYATHHEGLSRLNDPARNATGYDPDNAYFTTPDAEVLYLLVCSLQPRRVVEVGCGNSTRIIRQAIIDEGLPTELVAIDPNPRVDIVGLVDRFERRRLEEVEDVHIFEDLERNDILFIDSSHQVAVGNDVAHLFCRIMPLLKDGVVVHVHDVFLPYDYPATLAFEYSHWGEQYVLHAMIHSRDCEVIWPGYHVQRDRPDLYESLPFITEGRAQSFWFRWS